MFRSLYKARAREPEHISTCKTPVEPSWNWNQNHGTAEESDTESLEEEEEPEEVKTLKQALNKATEENVALAVEVSSFEEQMQYQKVRDKRALEG